MTVPVQNASVTAVWEQRPAAVCVLCSRVACFQARLEAMAGAGLPDAQPVSRRSNACASHLVGVIQELSAWSEDHELAGGLLTVLAIDPYALPCPAGAGQPPGPGLELQPELGFTFCTIAIGRPTPAIRPRPLGGPPGH
jgi:hypothetical protein